MFNPGHICLSEQISVLQRKSWQTSFSTPQIRCISLGPLAFTAIGYYSSGSISFCILDGLFCHILCLFIICFSMGKELFHSGSSDEHRWDDSVIQCRYGPAVVVSSGVSLALGMMGYHIYQRSVGSHYLLHTFKKETNEAISKVREVAYHPLHRCVN